MRGNRIKRTPNRVNAAKWAICLGERGDPSTVVECDSYNNSVCTYDEQQVEEEQEVFDPFGAEREAGHHCG